VGLWIVSMSSFPPASIKRTEVPGFSVKRLARTQPAEPAHNNIVVHHLILSFAYHVLFAPFA
jgi:hypothetical protein